MIAVVLKRGGAWNPGLPMAEQDGFAEHVALVTGLLDRGVAIEAGPFEDPSALQDDDLVALALLDIESVAAAETRRPAARVGAGGCPTRAVAARRR